MPVPKFLYHYYETEQGPFKNITRNGLKRAQEIQNNISVGFNSNRPSNYIELRFSTEKRLKELFINKGGQPKRDDPFYFTLGPSEWMRSCYKNPGTVKIPLTDFHPEQISFTYPDSMVSFQFHDEPKLSLYRKKCNGKIFTIHEIEDVINKYGFPTETKWQSEESLKYDRYIEVQVWDDTFIKKHQTLL